MPDPPTSPPPPPASSSHPPISSHNNSSVNRRRSLSRSSQGSAFRPSIGGKPILPPNYGATTSRNTVDSALSDSELGSASGSDGGFAGRIGSFSVTREELRDGSARLASLSLADTPGFPSPPSQSPAAASTGSSSSPYCPPVFSPDLESASAMSPSGLSLARPQLGTSPGELPAVSPAASGRLSPIPATPNDSRDSTPTQSALPLAPSPPSPVDPLPPASAVPEVIVASASGGSDERTPTPGGMFAEPEQRERDASRERERVPRALGDESGGANSEEEEDAMVEASVGDSAIVVDERTAGPEDEDDVRGNAHERTPLLGASGGQPNGGRASSLNRWHETFARKAKDRLSGWAKQAEKRGKEITAEDVKDAGKTAVKSVPAVILGTLMNVLDGVSYGLITYPTQIPAFARFGGIGVSQFFVSCIVAQLVFSSGGSIFAGGNGSMMIEVVPFFHAIVSTLQKHIVDDDVLVATTMFSFALSSVLTGLAFFALGIMKLGRLSEFFPRHILVGTIGGVGAFLFVTGLQVSARLEDADAFSLELARRFFESDVLPLWTIPLALAIILRLVTARYNHPLIFPSYFLAIPLVFYIVTAAARIPVEELREKGWVFELEGVDNKWYEFWTLFDLRKTDFGAILETIPNQLALVFFGLLHVPLNVPLLAIFVGEDNVDTDRELVAHGVSNFASGVVGAVPNYLVYVNSVLFYRNGGTTRISGFLLAAASVGVLVAGPGIIGFLPVSVVGALIFILGIDLVKEALWDTYGRVSRFEYATIWIIVIVMTIWDFTIGLAVGLILACVSFVIMSSQRRAIRSILTGSVARSTVRRHPKQAAFLHEVGRQIRVVKLQGFLFFGTISNVEEAVRKLLDAASWSTSPIRYLIIDFSMASGVDFSAAEAFVRMQRLLDERGVILVLCGCPVDSPVGVALRSVDLWSDNADGKVVVLQNLNDALEHCENAFLRSLYSKTFRPPIPSAPSGQGAVPIASQIELPKSELDSDIEGFASSPRANHLRTAARETMSRAEVPQTKMNFQQPLPILLQAFKPYSPDFNEDYCFRLVPYFKRVNVARGTTLWTDGSDPDAFYVIESGMLRATYVFADCSRSMSESMVAGTVAGEMSFLSRTKRNTTAVAERDSVLWRMDVKAHEEMGRKEGWAFARNFEETVLKIAVAEVDVLMGHLMASL
ncbi:hypothetical protein JCM10296v2_000707 [Rhodotorula toruloides]